MADTNADQKTFWSETAADKWLRYHQLLDASFEVVLQAVLDAADLQQGHHVLDVGCGLGTSCQRAADRVGAEGAVLGLDISDPFVAHARTQSADRPNISYLLDDAQDADLPEGRFDRLISRFGVMFFADTTAAFANMARAMKPGARMVFAAWGQPAENPWFMTPHKIAAARLGTPPKADRYAPGPFGFHDTEHTLAQLRAAGLDASVEVRNMQLATDVDIGDLAHVNTVTGPAGNIAQLFNGTQDDIDAIEAEVLDHLRATGPGVSAQINLFQATVPNR